MRKIYSKFNMSFNTFSRANKDKFLPMYYFSFIFYMTIQKFLMIPLKTILIENLGVEILPI